MTLSDLINFSTCGDGAFVAAGPGLRNSLPSHLKEADLSYNRLRRSLKKFCLDSGATARCELFQLRRLEITLLTYLLTYLQHS